MNTSFTMVCVSATLLMTIGLVFARPLLVLFGASADALVYAYPYMMLYLIGTLPSMIAVGMNPFINAQGYSLVGMCSVAIGAAANLLLDPLFIFVFGLGVQGAAVATVLSQLLSASFVLLFLTKRAELRVRFLRKAEFSQCIGYAKNIVSLGTSGFVMQLTNSLVTICCNNVLSVTGGDIYISVMTIVSSVRQLVETPIYALTEGTSPILSYNYGARRPSRVKNSGIVMALMVFGYTAIMWSLIILAPGMLIRIFSSDSVLVADAIPALKQYFAAFIFMDLQYIGQTTFKSLNKKKQAIFFLPAPKGIYRRSVNLSDALYTPHGHRWGFPCRTGVQRHRRQLLLYHNALHCIAGVKTDGTGHRSCAPVGRPSAFPCHRSQLLRQSAFLYHSRGASHALRGTGSPVPHSGFTADTRTIPRPFLQNRRTETFSGSAH